jgi:hypothetical protein
MSKAFLAEPMTLGNMRSLRAHTAVAKGLVE